MLYITFPRLIYEFLFSSVLRSFCTIQVGKPYRQTAKYALLASVVMFVVAL